MKSISRFVIVAALLLSTGPLWGQTIRVLAVNGTAELEAPGEAVKAVERGDLIVVGTRITTGADGRVALTPMPGVQSIIPPETTVILGHAARTGEGDAATEEVTFELRVGGVVTDIQRQPNEHYNYRNYSGPSQ